MINLDIGGRDALEPNSSGANVCSNTHCLSPAAVLISTHFEVKPMNNFYLHLHKERALLIDKGVKECRAHSIYEGLNNVILVSGFGGMIGMFLLLTIA